MGHLFERLHQKRAAKQRIREDSRQIAGIFLAGYFLYRLFTIGCDFRLTLRHRVNRHRIIVVHEAVHLETPVFVLVCSFFSSSMRFVYGTFVRICVPSVGLYLNKASRISMPIVVASPSPSVRRRNDCQA